MILKLKVAPIKMQDANKATLVSKIVNGKPLTIGTQGVYYSNMNDTFARVYNIQKVNKKTSQVKKNGVKGQVTQSTILRKKHWVANVYDLNISVLKAFDLTVEQEGNNFVISKRK